MERLIGGCLNAILALSARLSFLLTSRDQAILLPAQSAYYSKQSALVSQWTMETRLIGDTLIFRLTDLKIHHTNIITLKKGYHGSQFMFSTCNSLLILAVL